MKRVIIHFSAEGNERYLIELGADVEVLVIDDRVPHDRVFRMSASHSAEEIDALIGDDEIGHAGDARHAAVAARINAAFAGEPHLKLAPTLSQEQPDA